MAEDTHMTRAPPPELELGGGVAGWEDDGATPSTHASTPFLGAASPGTFLQAFQLTPRGSPAPPMKVKFTGLTQHSQVDPAV